jgi:riboflavin synthase
VPGGKVPLAAQLFLLSRVRRFAPPTAKRYLAGMFTGIIEEVGEVVEAMEGVLRIRARRILADAKLGDSIAINGVDLTVTEHDGDCFTANVMPETYRRSNLGELRAGDAVNLERAVRPTDRLSGHIVRGVVEGTATIASFEPEAEAVIARFRTPPALLRYMVVKGPVAIDGASLTIIDKTADSFAVSLVQYTQVHTNLLRKRSGDSVNIETDVIARYVETLMRPPSN